MRVNFTTENCLAQLKWWGGYVAFTTCAFVVIFFVDALARVLR